MVKAPFGAVRTRRPSFYQVTKMRKMQYSSKLHCFHWWKEAVMTLELEHDIAPRSHFCASCV